MRNSGLCLTGWVARRVSGRGLDRRWAAPSEGEAREVDHLWQLTKKGAPNDFRSACGLGTEEPEYRAGSALRLVLPSVLRGVKLL